MGDETVQPGDVRLIVKAPVARAGEDRGGGERHAFGNIIFAEPVAKDVPADKFERELGKALARLPQIFGSVDQHAQGGWQVGTITVSLAISAEGSVGFATVGTEASITVEFTRTTG